MGQFCDCVRGSRRNDEQVSEDLKVTAANLREVTQRLADGEGTLGKLSKDEELYDDARYLMEDIRAAVDDFRETAPILTFTSVFFGAF